MEKVAGRRRMARREMASALARSPGDANHGAAAVRAPARATQTAVDFVALGDCVPDLSACAVCACFVAAGTDRARAETGRGKAVREEEVSIIG